jgi:hypothetical protein
VHEAFGGKAGKLATQEAGDFRLVDFQDPGGLNLREAPCGDGLGHADRKIGLGQTPLGTGQTSISKCVPAAVSEGARSGTRDQVWAAG